MLFIKDKFKIVWFGKVINKGLVEVIFVKYK